MSWGQLRQLVPPPEVPTFVPTADDWGRVSSELGLDLPEELRQFCDLYGLGTFRGSVTTSLSLSCPGYPNFVDNFRDECQRLRDIRGPSPSTHHPFRVFPEEGGLLPLALDENDIWVCWGTKGRPDRWPIVIRWNWGVEGMRVFEIPLSELLVSLFERRIELPCFPLPTFVDDVSFIPYRDDVTIGGDPINL